MFVMPVATSLHRRALREAGIPQTFAHLLGERYCAPAASADATHAEARVPTMDVLETDTAFSVVLDLPGVIKEQLNVSVEGRRVSVSTAVAATPEAPAATPDTAAPTSAATRVLYRERSAPVYARTVVLPAEVDQAASQARFEQGVLTLTLAKRVPSGATQIRID
jgi:HSP20 family protein